MPDSELPRTPNWADYIDSLHVFNPYWLVRARRASQAKRTLGEGLDDQATRAIDEHTEPRPGTEQ
ncbi:MAG: hypothetical protein K2X67_16260 [Burkholderiales bacterium]|nr:hypothetical protein [Burkholderiales bacterium]